MSSMREATYIVLRRAVLIQIKTTTATIRMVVEIFANGANELIGIRLVMSTMADTGAHAVVRAGTARSACDDTAAARRAVPRLIGKLLTYINLTNAKV